MTNNPTNNFIEEKVKEWREKFTYRKDFGTLDLSRFLATSKEEPVAGGETALLQEHIEWLYQALQEAQAKLDADTAQEARKEERESMQRKSHIAGLLEDTARRAKQYERQRVIGILEGMKRPTKGIRSICDEVVNEYLEEAITKIKE